MAQEAKKSGLFTRPWERLWPNGMAFGFKASNVQGSADSEHFVSPIALQPCACGRRGFKAQVMSLRPRPSRSAPRHHVPHGPLTPRTSSPGPRHSPPERSALLFIHGILIGASVHQEAHGLQVSSAGHSHCGRPALEPQLPQPASHESDLERSIAYLLVGNPSARPVPL